MCYAAKSLASHVYYWHVRLSSPPCVCVCVPCKQVTSKQGLKQFLFGFPGSKQGQNKQLTRFAPAEKLFSVK